MKTIVIIEDDTDAQEAYQQILAPQGFRTIFATTGQLGLQIIKAEKPHLVVLDLLLSGSMNGMEVIKAIKKYPALKDIPILVVTNLHSEREAAIKLGANGVLAKSATSINKLVDHIKKYISS